MSGRSTPTNNAVAGLGVCVVPVVVIVPPPVATTFVLAAHVSAGTLLGVMTIGIGLVVVLGGVVPTLLFSVTVAV